MAKKKKQFIPLSDDLEKLALSALMRGLIPETELHEEELSKLGKIILQSVKQLRSYEATPDEIPTASVQATASEILGADHREVGMYINSCMSPRQGERRANSSRPSARRRSSWKPSTKQATRLRPARWI